MLRFTILSRFIGYRRSLSTAPSSAPDSGVLKDVTILDLSRVLAGPFCTQLLGDMGANVIKIERPGSGDDTRGYGPPFHAPDVATYYLSVNRNKKSVAIDLKKPKGVELIQRLAVKSDVMVENFIPGVINRLGLGFDEIKKVNPTIIYCSISGFGQHDPRAGYDVIASSEGGLLSITGSEDGPPCKPGVPVIDMITGLYSISAIMAALYKKEKGRGALEAVHIDTNLLSAQASILINVALNALDHGVIAQRRGTAHESIVPYEAFGCKPEVEGQETDYLTVGGATEAQFKNLIMLLYTSNGEKERGEQVASDPQFGSNADRVKNRKNLIPLMQHQFGKKTRKEWIEHFSKTNLPYGPVNRLDQVFGDEDIRDQTTFKVNGTHLLKPAINFLNQNDSFYREITLFPPLKVGQDTQSVLTSMLNLDRDTLSGLRDDKVIYFEDE